MTIRDLPPFRDLRAFVRSPATREATSRRIATPISLVHEMTEVHRRVPGRRRPGAAVRGGARRGGRTRRHAGAHQSVRDRASGSRPGSASGPSAHRRTRRDARRAARAGAGRGLARRSVALADGHARRCRPGRRSCRAPLCQAEIAARRRRRSGRLPIQTCWPGEPAPLITWPLVITRPPETAPTTPRR